MDNGELERLIAEGHLRRDTVDAYALGWHRGRSEVTRWREYASRLRAEVASLKKERDNALMLLEMGGSSEQVDAELRALGLDPEAVGEEGLAFVKRVKAEFAQAQESTNDDQESV